MKLKSAASLVAVAVGLRAAVALIQALLARRRDDDRYDGLDSVVSFSSRMIAASRAVETREGEMALVRDPLAERLAGRKAYEKSEQRAQAAPEGSSRRKQVGMMAIRTRWFDDQLLAALGRDIVPAAVVPSALRGVPAAAGGAEAGSSAVAEAEGPYVVGGASGRNGTAAEPPRQVVLLGAGMDSRPWRLDLPEGVRWFEVDRADVLEAKKGALAAMGAQLRKDPSTQPQPAAGAAANGSNSSNGSKEFAFPLRAASWVGVACDLCSPGWVAELAAAGFDPGRPTVWVAEGLLMYLTQEEVEALLREMAGASAPGSLLVAVSVTEAVIRDIQAKGAGTELTGTWKFGCPPDPTEFLASHGWQLEHALTRGQMATRLGLDPALCGFKLAESIGGDAGAPAGVRSLFFVAGSGGGSGAGEE